MEKQTDKTSGDSAGINNKAGTETSQRESSRKPEHQSVGLTRGSSDGRNFMEL
jgi:hypothetical protein